MDITIVNQNENFCYDPQISGFDANFFKTVTGSDPTVSSSKLRFTSNEVSSYSFYRYLDIEFILNMPTAPTAGDDRSWGLKVPSLGNRGRVEFNINGAVFSALAYDDAGNEEINQAITWDGDWTTTDTRFGIRITPLGIKFLIDGVVFVRGETRGNEANPDISSIPGSIHIDNGNADNMDMTCLIVKNAQSVT